MGEKGVGMRCPRFHGQSIKPHASSSHTLLELGNPVTDEDAAAMISELMAAEDVAEKVKRVLSLHQSP
jgi:hypothetical protein